MRSTVEIPNLKLLQSKENQVHHRDLDIDIVLGADAAEGIPPAAEPQALKTTHNNTASAASTSIGTDTSVSCQLDLMEIPALKAGELSFLMTTYKPSAFDDAVDESTEDLSVLWPCVIMAKRPLRNDLPLPEGLVEQHKRLQERLEAFQSDRYEYLIKVMPLPAESIAVDASGSWLDQFVNISVCASSELTLNLEMAQTQDSVICVPDYFLIPDSFSTRPVLCSDRLPLKYQHLLKKALIQAVFLQSSWALLEEDTISSIPSIENRTDNRNMESKEDLEESTGDADKDTDDEKEIKKRRRTVKLDVSITTPITIPSPIPERPIWTTAIKMECPNITSLYQNARIPQHMIEPKLLSRFKSGSGVVDLTPHLLSQGTSHWKNSKGRVTFFLSKPVPSLPRPPPFPKSAVYDGVRLGSWIIQPGDFVTLQTGQVVQVRQIRAPKGLLTFAGRTLEGQEIKVKSEEVKGRFTGIFEGGRGWKGGIRVRWDGRPFDFCERRIQTK